ncbi:hypothetical protein TNCV_2385981 [Trichonephila clavipes]|nr:hypothetical protein TNCV_2385981 [Trichonephila clavipes]
MQGEAEFHRQIKRGNSRQHSGEIKAPVETMRQTRGMAKRMRDPENCGRVAETCKHANFSFPPELLQGVPYETLMATVEDHTAQIIVASAGIASTPNNFECVR